MERHENLSIEWYGQAASARQTNKVGSLRNVSPRFALPLVAARHYALSAEWITVIRKAGRSEPADPD
jgi:hypothetical protein